ncbi:polysaccharide biosynthesis tyrosine autokinase [Actinomycetospora soli]|uniref:polysaccharide biosynthesis tyrosine autokinase n=1 Tax=Actinomycetospora soli TaxID=2893887 RepID=UPI001E4A6E70|nr:polysaccharide biosynthesis tyrosine autokinase [Actinomycetospora soli]
MDLGGLLAIVRRNWRITSSVFVLTLLLAVVALVLTPTKYAATVTLYVFSQNNTDNASAAYQGSLLSEQRVKSYSDLFVSNRIGQAVVDSLGLPESPEEVTSEIAVSAEPQSVLLAATVTDQSPERAIAIANAAANAFTRLVADIEQPPDRTRPPAVAVRQIEPAVPSPGPVSPRWLLTLATAGVMGLFLGIAAAYVRNFFNNAVQSVKSAEEIAGVPALGVIPESSDLSERRAHIEGDEFSSSIEAYRRLRTNLAFVSVDKSRKRLVVTSSIPGEGKTTAVCNLAAVAGQAGLKTLIVDADLRRPMVADSLSLESQVGLTSALTGRVATWGAIQASRMPNVQVMTSGPLPPNPSELLSSDQMRKLMDDVESDFDLILIDSPPLVPVTDAAVASQLCDGTMIVCRHNFVKPEQLATSVDSLGKADADVVGLIYNAAKRSEPLASAQYYAYKQQRPVGTAYALPIDADQTKPSPRPHRNLSNESK